MIKRLKNRIKKLTKKEKAFIIVLLAFSMVFLALSIYLYINDKNNAQNELNNAQNQELFNTSYYINNDGNVVSDNLCQYSSVRDNVTIATLPIGTYNISLYTTSMGGGINIRKGSISGDVIIYFENNRSSLYYNSSFILTEETSLFFNAWGNGWTNYNIMLNEGSTALDYEPYGTWYSQDNYNDYGLQEYNNGNLNANILSNIDVSCYWTNNDSDDELLGSLGHTRFYDNGSISINYNRCWSWLVSTAQNDNDYYHLKFNFDNNTDLNTIYYLESRGQLDSEIFISYVDTNGSRSYSTSLGDLLKFSYEYNEDYTHYIYQLDLFSLIPNFISIDYIMIYSLNDNNFVYSLSNNSNIFNYKNGYDIGYNEGVTYADGRINIDSASYEEGRDVGYYEGYSIGHSDGLSEGYADGYNEGVSTAQTESYNEGYAKGASDTELKYFYFDNKTLKVYTAQTENETLIGTEILHQDSYTNFYIDVTDLIEDYGQYETILFYRGDIDLNILSSDFYCNAIYPTSDIEGYFTIYYADGTIYDVPTYDLNREYHIYDGSITNPNKIITSISFAFHYDKLLTIELSCSPSSISYTNGYNNGYDKGYTSGKVDGNTIGYNSGYQVGYNEGASTDITTNGMKTLFNSILSYPINMLQSVFNFNFMGINIASFIMFLVSLGIVAFVLKKFLK